MQTRPIDYLLSSLVLTLIGLAAWSCAAGTSYLATRPVLGPYHVLADALVFLLAFGAFAALAAHLIRRLHPLRPGRHAMDMPLFTAWKLYTVVHEFGRGAWLPFTTVFARPLVAALFGARIGKDIALGGMLVDPHLITIGDRAIIGQDSVLTAHAITSGEIILQPVTIGRGATVGVNAVIMPGTEIGEGAVVTAGSVVPPGTRIPPRELWGGVPARKLKDIVDAATIRG